MQLNSPSALAVENRLAVGLQFEEEEGVKRGGSGFKEWCDLLGEYNGWEGIGAEKQCWLTKASLLILA